MMICNDNEVKEMITAWNLVQGLPATPNEVDCAFDVAGIKVVATLIVGQCVLNAHKGAFAECRLISHYHGRRCPRNASSIVCILSIKKILQS